MAAVISPNLGRKADKPIRDALLAAARQDPSTLKRVAEAILGKAINGDVAAFKEVADRIDGKVAQAIIGGDENDAPIRTSLEIVFKNGSRVTE